MVDREPKLRVMVHDDAVVNQALADMVVRHRFHGLLHAHCPPEIGVKAIRAVMRGELWLPRALLRAHLPAANAPVAGDGTASLYATLPEGLTDRQNEIVAHLRQGFTNKEIAGRLGIKEDTVKKHLQAVFSKLGVHRRALVALRGRESRLPAAR
ncbi:MAG TPA: response regulator transcription factor [Burkholderiaceae bacterium]|nr:response regulator transcription factor [Burkholderiaceae bacterium]